MEHRCGVVWFRNDLRLHDNEALNEAVQGCDEVVGIYVFDERLCYGKSAYGFARWSPLRLAYITAVVRQLQEQMAAIGGRLIVRTGKKEEEVLSLVREAHARWVFCNRERTTEEVEIQDRLEEWLWQIGREIRYSRGKMLIHTADLPFPVSHVPDSFASFKKEVSYLKVRPCFAAPSQMCTPNIAHIEDEYPDLADMPSLSMDQQAHLEELIDVPSLLAHMDGPHSSPLSPALSMGTLSPKRLYHKLVDEHPGISLLRPTDRILHLLLRDHKRLMGKKYGDAIFQPRGVHRHSEHPPRCAPEVVHRIAEGRIGEPIIDAAIQCLIHTGYLSAQMRHLLADYFIYEMGLDWRCGAELFECYLLDYDPCSNYVNWQQEAGIGPDSEVRSHALNIEHQARTIDPDGSFRRRWAPEMA